MAKYLTDRHDRKLADIVRKVDGLTGRNNRQVNTELLGSPGTDFGTPIVPRTLIPKATRSAQPGSDDFCPGEGTAYLFKLDEATGCITPWFEAGTTNVIFKTVYNLSTTQEYQSNDIAFLLEDGGIYELEDDTPFELEADPGGTDFIGPDTPVLFAAMDRAGKLFLPPDEGLGTVQHTIEGFSAGADGSEILFNQEKLLIVGDHDEFPSTVGNVIDVSISNIPQGVQLDIKAIGDLFNFVDTDQIPPANTEPVALGAGITVESVIDPAQLAFAITRVSPSKITNNFGRVFEIAGDTGIVDAFPSDDILIQGGGTLSVNVSKVLDQIIITITD